MGMQQTLESDARKTFARLFPQARGYYTLGVRLQNGHGDVVKHSGRGTTPEP